MNKNLTIRLIKILIAIAYIILGVLVAFLLNNLRLSANQQLMLGLIISLYGIFRLIRAISTKNLK